MFYIIPGR